MTPSNRLPVQMHKLPKTGFLRLHQIIGNPKAKPPIPAIIPVKIHRSYTVEDIASFQYPLNLNYTPWLNLIKNLNNSIKIQK